jgi:hypothetical protein
MQYEMKHKGQKNKIFKSHGAKKCLTQENLISFSIPD